MQLSLSSILSLLALTATTVLAGDASTVSWDSTYDNAAQSTLTLACSDGINGLYTKGYKTLGAIPKFPLVGASPTVPSWNSPNCGACYKIYYKPPNATTGNSIYVTAVDASRSNGFVLSKAAMNALTNNQADMLGRVDVSYAPADVSNCGWQSA